MTFLTPQQVAVVAKGAGWTGADLVVAIAVCFAESGGWLEAVSPAVGVYPNGNRDFGLWQIDKAGPDHPELFVASYNAGVAYGMWQTRKWEPWVAYANGSYRTFMSIAQLAVDSFNHPLVHLANLYFTARNEDVRLVQQALIVRKLLDPSLATGYYYTATRAAYTKWQNACGFFGPRAADGIPGRRSLELLGFQVA